MNDFFNSLSNSFYSNLCDLDKSIHQTNLKDTFVDEFIHDLKSFLFKSDSIYKLSKLPESTLLDINEVYDEYIQCYFNNEEYPVPKDMVYSNDLEGLFSNGYNKLQLQDDGLYHVIELERNDT